MSRVVVSHSKLGWVNLRSAKLGDVVFRDCRIDELDLTGARIERLAFEDTTVDGLVLTGSRARDLDLRGAELHRIDGLEGLRGAILSSRQAVELSELLVEHLGASIGD